MNFPKPWTMGKKFALSSLISVKLLTVYGTKGLIYKLKNIGITGSLLLWIENYLLSRKQKVLLNGKESIILSINAGVPQGSILGPLFFLIFINDIVTEVGCSIKLFADDTSIYVIIENAQMDAYNLNENLTKKSTTGQNNG